MLDEDPGFSKEIIANIALHEIDWQILITLGSNYLILASNYMKFKSHTIQEYLPTKLVEHLKEIYDQNIPYKYSIIL